MQGVVVTGSDIGAGAAVAGVGVVEMAVAIVVLLGQRMPAEKAEALERHCSGGTVGAHLNAVLCVSRMAVDTTRETEGEIFIARLLRMKRTQESRAVIDGTYSSRTGLPNVTNS